MDSGLRLVVAAMAQGRPALDPLTGEGRMGQGERRMRRLTAALLTMGLIGTSAGVATAQSPAASLGPTDRQGPGTGFALTFPDDWLVLDLVAVDAAEHLEAVRSAYAHPVPAQMVEALLGQLPAMTAEGFEFHIFALGPPDDDGFLTSTCMAQSFDEPAGVTLQSLMARDVAQLASFPDIVEGPTSSVLDLPAGRSGRLDYVSQSQSGTRLFNSGFYLAAEETLATDAHDMQLACNGYSDYGDDWLSIAETFEFLPAEE